MTDTFQSRLPTLPDEDLLRYVKAFHQYRSEAVEAALLELDRRHLALSEQDRAAIRQGLAQRSAEAQAHLHRSLVTRLGATTPARLHRIRQITSGLLASGLGIALAIYLLAPPQGANPLGYEPEDTKKYLHDLELYGGKVNVLATELNHWWDGLWHGRGLAFTVATLTTLLALAFWFIATRRARELEG